MTVISNSYGPLHELSIHYLPSTLGEGVSANNDIPNRRAMIFARVDTLTAADTLDLNTWVPGTLNAIEGMPYAAVNNTNLLEGASATWSGTTITFVGHPVDDATTATWNIGVIGKWA